MSGTSETNFSRRAGDLNLYVPAMSDGIVESAHATILHCWIDAVAAELKASAGRTL